MTRSRQYQAFRRFSNAFSLFLVMSTTCSPCKSDAATITVFYDNFDGGQTLASGVGGGFSGVTTTASVEGYSGYGNAGNEFSGNYLHNATPQPDRQPFVGPALGRGDDTVLTLTGLPQHTGINLQFLLAILDSWDGDSVSSGPDRFNIDVDGTLVFSETFSEVPTQPGRSQSYDAPVNGLLVIQTQLAGHPGFSPDNFLDAAYDMYFEPLLTVIPHSSSTLTVKWFADGDGYEGGFSESWAIENLQIQLTGVVPEPNSLVLIGPVIVIGGLIRRFRTSKRICKRSHR